MPLICLWSWKICCPPGEGFIYSKDKWEKWSIWRALNTYMIVHCRRNYMFSLQDSLLEIVSGSLYVGGRSAPLLEYSLHLLAAAAALLALSFTAASSVGKCMIDKSTIECKQFYEWQLTWILNQHRQKRTNLEEKKIYLWLTSLHEQTNIVIVELRWQHS